MQWFPGHMAKAKNEIVEKLKLVDIVYELVDARIPYSSQNPMISDILKNKEKLIIITKFSMADDYMTKKWQNHFKSQNIASIIIDSLTGFNVSRIVAMSKTVLEAKLAKERSRGIKERAIRAMVIGIPNVGKSTLINRLVNRKVTNVGNKPGVTKAQQWIRINKDLDLLDTPGVLWPKFEDPKVGMHLGLTGAIKDEILHKEDMIFYLLDFLKKYYPNLLESKYEVSISLDNIDMINKIASNRGIYKNAFEVVTDTILNDFKNARIGRITLDRLENE